MKKFLLKLFGIMKTRTTYVGNKDDDKHLKFERALLRLLRRYGYYNPKVDCLQKLIIKCSVGDLPTIVTENLIFDKPKGNQSISQGV